MNTDHDFQIGSEHKVCQDFADSGIGRLNPNSAYAIVCDGCSDSPEVDLGARILAKSALRSLCEGPEFNYQEFGLETIKYASKVFEFFQWDIRALNSTLLVAWVRDGHLKAYLYGDGTLVHKTARSLETVNVSFSPNKADYLSYHLNADNKDAYDAEGVTKQIETPSYINLVSAFTPVEYTAPVTQGDIIALMSDGASSFKKPNGEIVPVGHMIPEFVNFKSTKGVFVHRRLAALKRNFQKEGITHTDDISMAAIVI